VIGYTAADESLDSSNLGNQASRHPMTTRKEDFARDRFASANGIELVEVAPGRATTRLCLSQQHLNNLDLAHGGALFTLAAAALFAACNAAGQAAVGIQLSISFLQPVAAGTLTARATEIARSRRLSTCEVRVLNDDGQQVALLTGTAYIKDEPYPPAS
jgi:acyl-CoA thioesterase